MADAGDRLSNATRIRFNSGKAVLRNQIGNGDENDYFKFRLNRSRRFVANLRRMSQNANIELIQDLNGNGQLDAGETIASSRRSGSGNERIKLSQLEQGLYYLRVTPEDSDQTRYKLVVKHRQSSDLSLAEQVVDLTNQERTQNGLEPLAFNTQLAIASRRHARRMARQDFVSHIGLDGSTPSDRAIAAGYPVGAGENVGAGYDTAEAIVEGWMDSPGHRANILNADYTEIGVGFFYLRNDTGSENWNNYWAQAFSNPNINYV